VLVTAQRTDRREVPRANRPLWLSIPVVLIGAVVVSGIIALAAHHTFYAIVLYSALIGLAGGMFGWALVDEFGAQGTWLAAAAGFVFAAGMYVLYRYIEYRLATSDLDGAIGWLDHLRAGAEGGSVYRSRPGTTGIQVGETVTWAIWVLELTVAATVGALLGKKLEI
jgi:hypothetical protein